MQKKVAAMEQTAKSQLLREDNAKKINRIPIVPLLPRARGTLLEIKMKLELA